MNGRARSAAAALTGGRSGADEPLLTVRGLRVEASSPGGTVVALDGVDLDIDRGEIIGLIGESGSGKTTLARSIIGLHERNVRVVGGSIAFDGQTILNRGATGAVDRHASIRGRHVGMIFQSSRGSLHPLRKIGSQFREVVAVHRPELTGREADRRARLVFSEMGLDPERVLGAYPHQLSGGMCQRAAIAIAIGPEPNLIIADECTSALDVTSQAEVVKVLRTMAGAHHTAILFVTHDVLLASELCSRVVVLRSGQVEESGPTDGVLHRPVRLYTQQLIAAVPKLV